LNPYSISGTQFDAIAMSRWGISLKGNLLKLHTQTGSEEVLFYAPYSPFANLAFRRYPSCRRPLRLRFSQP